MNRAILDKVECTIFESTCSCGIPSYRIISSSTSASSRVRRYVAFRFRWLACSSARRSCSISCVHCCNISFASRTIRRVHSALSASCARSALAAGQGYGARLRARPMLIVSDNPYTSKPQVVKNYPTTGRSKP
jgi:hypothetical protein